MPYKSEKIKLPEEYDRRVKLTKEDKETVVKMYQTGIFSQSGLARLFGVSKSTIAIVVNPQRAESVRLRRIEHMSDYKMSREENTRRARERRRYKQQLYLEGKIGN